MSNVEEQIRLYRQGLSYSQIAKHTNTTAAMVQRSIRAWNLHPKQVEPVTQSVEEIQALRERIRSLRGGTPSLRAEGLSMKAIGRQVGIEEILVYRHLQILGLL
ncbi:hypothetical protein QUB33_05860 [Microcoleus sp. B3-A4]|uniref:hypothetical protein n=1 Tax=Microcoleus sp. B3-A4 TaxID=2818653 RepID=UPI002FD71AC3